MHEGVNCQHRKKVRCLALVRHPVERFLSYYQERTAWPLAGRSFRQSALFDSSGSLVVLVDTLGRQGPSLCQGRGPRAGTPGIRASRGMAGTATSTTREGPQKHDLAII